jgi:phage terminase large subunit GpA-like protein
MLSQGQIETRQIALANHEHDGHAADAFLARLDNLLPAQSISTNDFAATKRLMVNPGGDPFPYDPQLTPYAAAINDAMDNPLVHVVAVKGNTRSAKTVSAENYVLKQFTYGPLKNVLWFMQDEDSINDYIDERGEEMLRIHPEVNERIDWNDKRNSRKRKKVGKALLLYRPATARHTRGKAAPIIVADEINAYMKKIRDAIMTLITSRQEEFGNDAKAFIASHPDGGPDVGIDAVQKDCLQHLWWVQCPHCLQASSPSPQVEDVGGLRLDWNVPELMARADEFDRVSLLDFVAENVVLICPHDGCHAIYTPEERLALMRSGRWLQPHQKWTADGIEGDPRVAKMMGFVIDFLMSPFVKLRETARDWAAAKLTSDTTGLDTHLNEVTVKKMGRTFLGTTEEEQMDSWKVVQGRLASNYPLKVVPTGAVFLTAFVDVQGDRFEVRVVAWDLARQSWLVDAYAIKQWPKFGNHSAFENIDPGNRLTDWDVIEEAVLAASYPLQSNPQRLELGKPELYLPIARTIINSSGQPGVTNNARVWLSNLLSRPAGEGRQIASYRVMLMQGTVKGEVYGPSKPILRDDHNRLLPIPVIEAYPNVHEIKRIIGKRMKIAEPGPGRMHMPATLSSRYARELTAERLINGEWIPHSRANETWDGWVACEFARATLQPDRPELWSGPYLPEWADPRPRGAGIETVATAPVSVFDRLAALDADNG